MANLKSDKDVWMNKLRQTKEYKLDPVKQIMAQQIDEELEEGIKEMVDKHQEDELEIAKQAIVDKITRHLSDIIFENVCNEMGNHYVFQSQNYLTEAGYEQFEDEWFEFYHEHHGDIMYEVMKNLFNQPNITN